MAKATLANAEVAYERAQALLKTATGTQKAFDEAEAALRTAQARLSSAQTRLARRKAMSPVAGSVQQIYYRPGETGAGRPAGGCRCCRPATSRCASSCRKPILPRISLGEPVSIHCDGCKAEVPAKVTLHLAQLPNSRRR